MTITLEEIVKEETEHMFGNWFQGHGIGSSDISACVRNILDTAGRCGVEVDGSQVNIRWMINDALCEMEESA
tara:strand:- start:401 stop:616 length:216 start_codon:yes stop_codon:yes gene_type:complete